MGRRMVAVTGSGASGRARATPRGRERYVALCQRALQDGHYRKAAELGCKAVVAAPGDASVRKLAGLALSEAGNPDMAVAQLYEAMRLAPDDAGIRFCLAVSLQRAGRLDDAMVEYRACLDREPDHRQALWNYADMLRVAEYFGAALACFEYLQLLEGVMRPTMAHRMAVCCSHLGMKQRADELFEQQLRDSASALTQWEYAHHLLLTGRSEAAWPHYAMRFAAAEYTGVRRGTYPFAWWEGEFRAGAALLVQGEQGAGDEMLLAAFYGELISLARVSGMRVILACRPNMVRLFEASFPGAVVIARVKVDCIVQPGEVADAVEGCAPVWTVMAGDVPLWIGRPRAQPYLIAHEADRQSIRVMLGPRTRPRIGLAWASSTELVTRARLQRNVAPALMANLVVALSAGAGGQAPEFFSLHTAQCRSDLAWFSEVCVRDMSGSLGDFSCTAALIGELDMVISVCTSTANLAGALGADTRVLLRQYADWRWYEPRPWYAHVTTYRQCESGDWSHPLSTLRQDLLEVLRHWNLGDESRRVLPKQS